MAITSNSRFGAYLPAGLSITALLLCVIYNAIVFSALASHPVVGSALRGAIRNDAPLVSAYVFIGDGIRALGPLSALGNESAERIAQPISEKIRGFPPGSVAILFGRPMSAQQSQLQWTHQLMPFLLLIAGILWWRRPRQVHMMPRRR